MHGSMLAGSAQYGSVNTHWRTGTCGSTMSTRMRARYEQHGHAELGIRSLISSRDHLDRLRIDASMRGAGPSGQGAGAPLRSTMSSSGPKENPTSISTACL